MAYEIKLSAPAERETSIQKACEASKTSQPFFDFRDDRADLPVIRLPIDLPIYRMANFRTFTDQSEHIAKNKLKSTYFLSGQEVESIQQVQHELLIRLAKTGRAGSIVPVYDVLEKQGQREPLLLSATGVVVNGNRRLAAMRELGWSHANFMVLPSDATASDILDIEANLQGKPETKLDYDWIGDGELIAALVEYGDTHSDVAKKLHRSEKDIKIALRAIMEADLYLKEWAHAEGEYSRIRDDAEQFFKDLAKALEGKDDELAQASRVIAWSLFDNREDIPGRLYNYNAAFGHLASDVLERTAEELGISLAEDGEDSEDEDDDGGFDVDLEDEEGAVSYDAVIDALKDDGTREDAVAALIEASQSAIEYEKGQKSGEAALKALSLANGKMASVDLSKAAKSTYVKIKKQLDAIESHCKKLRSKLEELE